MNNEDTDQVSSNDTCVNIYMYIFICTKFFKGSRNGYGNKNKKTIIYHLCILVTYSYVFDVVYTHFFVFKYFSELQIVSVQNIVENKHFQATFSFT